MCKLTIINSWDQTPIHDAGWSEMPSCFFLRAQNNLQLLNTLPCRVKVRYFLYLTKYTIPWRHLALNYAWYHEDIWVRQGTSPCILNPGTRWRWVVSFMFLLLDPQGNSPPSTHWIGGWVGPRDSLDRMAKRKISSPCQDSNPGHPACSLVAIWLSNLSCPFAM
jgi:hypothetical protein